MFLCYNYSEWVLDPSRHGLSNSESVEGSLEHCEKLQSASNVGVLVDNLKNIYCGSITVEIGHMMVCSTVYL